MKKQYLILAALAGLAALTGCGETSSVGPKDTTDQEIVDSIAGRSALVISSSTNKGLVNGAAFNNTLKSPTYLYVNKSFMYAEARISSVSTDVTTTISWTYSLEGAFTVTPFGSSGVQDKYVPAYKTTEQKVTLTGVVTYGTATATATFNITLTAKAAA